MLNIREWVVSSFANQTSTAVLSDKHNTNPKYLTTKLFSLKISLVLESNYAPKILIFITRQQVISKIHSHKGYNDDDL